MICVLPLPVPDGQKREKYLLSDMLSICKYLYVTTIPFFSKGLCMLLIERDKTQDNYKSLVGHHPENLIEKRLFCLQQESSKHLLLLAITAAMFFFQIGFGGDKLS